MNSSTIYQLNTPSSHTRNLATKSSNVMRKKMKNKEKRWSPKENNSYYIHYSLTNTHQHFWDIFNDGYSAISKGNYKPKGKQIADPFDGLDQGQVEAIL